MSSTFDLMWPKRI